MESIRDIATKLGIPDAHLVPHGQHTAKIALQALQAPRAREGKARLVLVSAMTPTPAGEGKTTVAIGLADALTRAGQRACVALREPSLGPSMGKKGGGTGGGQARLVPSERITLHFTGDLHAISSAHNLLAAVVDNHLHHDSELELDPLRVLWPRVVDMNDRALRHIVIGLGGDAHGTPRESSFDITAASELMAMLCLARDMDDLRGRIDRMLVAVTRHGKPVEARAFAVTGAMLALLRDALMPNLVQTREGTPALVHGGPFANIAHGCSSALATRTGLAWADWVITEAGFGFDLGGEKFFHIKCRSAGLDPDVVVIVATLRALKFHGGVDAANLHAPDPGAVARGLANLEQHIRGTRLFKGDPIVALNRFDADTDEEVGVLESFCAGLGVELAVCEPFQRGGAGATDLGRAVMAGAQRGAPPARYLYDSAASIPDKIRLVATQVYGAADARLTPSAMRDLREIEHLGHAHLPICMAKTASSLSDDPTLRGRPSGFVTTVRGLRVHAGAGFIVALTGEITRMPGLPRHPRAERIDVAPDGTIQGLD